MKRTNYSIISLIFLLIACDQPVSKVSKSPVSKDSAKKQHNTPPGFGYDNETVSLGVGVVEVPEFFEVYSDSTLNKVPEKVDIYKEATSFYSKFYKPDYGIMHFVCLDKTDKAYKVIINYDEIRYLPKTEGYVFKDWQSYILSSFGIKRTKIVNLKAGEPLPPIKKEPIDSASYISLPKEKHELFCPLLVQGDWVKVTYDCFYNSSDFEGDKTCQEYIKQCANPVTGWIRWRTENKLLIDIAVLL
jgi:hypothetical protein